MSFRNEYYVFLQKVFGFDKWHLVPMEDRPYAQSLARKINFFISDKKINGGG